MIVNRNKYPLFIAIPCFLPLLRRLLLLDVPEPIGLLSDLGCGLLLWTIALAVPFWVRLPLLLSWVLFQAISQELYEAIQRLPSLSDLLFLADPTFVFNSLVGMHLAHPVFVVLLLLSFFLTIFLRANTVRPKFLVIGALAGILALAVQIVLSHRHEDVSVASRYNPLHWFARDALLSSLQGPPLLLTVSDLPLDLRQADMNGTLLLEKGRARNVLIIIMEGLTGLYHPEIRAAMGVKGDAFAMERLAEATAGGMLVPDFATHSHQTIRGLYSMLCGDFSKFSFETPKAFDLQQNLGRAGDCLPARMAGAGWTTHFLQAASLNFMSKDRVMPMIGFQKVHGSEWFTEDDPEASMWGPSDPAFFRQVIPYIQNLRKEEKPWLLTLLTVGTHHPFHVSDEVAERYPDRRTATVAILDTAVADFIKWLHHEKVLEDTLVILTSDESHGSELAEWMSSWGLCTVLAPSGETMPRLKAGTYGLVDVTPSVLDYFGLDMPSAILGRSIFRDYQNPREMVSYTGGKLRWFSGGISYECTRDGNCLKARAHSLLGEPIAILGYAEQAQTHRLWAMASTMDRSLVERQDNQVMQFAGGEVRKLPEKWGNEWSDSLAGAQYLHFPAGSKVHVSIRVVALEAADDGLQLQLFLRQNEQLVSDIAYEAFPTLHRGEEGKIQFNFVNDEARQSFSFHLVGEGKDATVQLEEFNVTIEQTNT